MLGIIGAIIVAFLSLFIPGLLFSLALFKGTDLSKFEVVTIGFIFGLIATPTLTWLESYVDSYVHAFSFSLTLFEANAVLLSIIGILLCIYEGVFSLNGLRGRRNKATTEAQPEPVSAGKEYAQMLDEQRAQIKNMGSAQEMINVHVREEQELLAKQQSEFSLVNLTDEEKAKVEELHKKAYEDLAKKHFEEERKYVHNEKEDKSDIAHEKSKVNIKQAAVTNWYWIALLVLMLVAFGTRIANIAVSPTYFEFDPYFDMIDAEYVITFGHQLLLDPSAWPVVIGGTNHRIQPLIPYMEAYWYDLANVMKFHYTTFSTSLMSYVSSFYPPITAALLVFVIFMLLYHEYGKHIAIIGASLTAMMPVLITTFIAGEQLLEPWGIFSLFFFFAAYLLAVKDPHNVRYAILAGVAFASTFLGAHYYTVDAGVLAIYILVQGVISVLRKEETRGFYKMNIIVIAIIAVFYLLYAPYSATLTGRIPSILHIPIIISLPLFALVLVALFEYIPKLAEKYRIAGIKASFSTYILWMVVLLIIIFALIFATPIGKPLRAYVNLSERFTTPATPLFMTVQEFEPTGMLFNFGSAGFGALGYTLSFTNAAGTTTSIPIAVLLIAGIATILILISVFYRNSKSGIFYLAIAFPLMFAGFSEVKYLPHFGVAEIMLLGIIMGELMFLAQNHYRLKTDDSRTDSILSTTFKEHKTMFHFVIILGLFFVFGRAILLVLLVYFLVYLYIYKKERGRYINYMLAITILLAIASLASAQFAIGESSPLLQVFAASYNYAAHGASACTAIANNGNSVGYDMFCNQVPAYWISAAAWMRSNVGPYAPRILAWWDYGDWINWFGNSNAVLRGDNAIALLDYRTAARYVLGASDGYGPSNLASFMNNVTDAKYVLFDNQLTAKWQALDFLGCVGTNQTSKAFAVAAGQSVGQPYLLGTSTCELNHDPTYLLVPLSTSSVSDYCQLSGNATALRTLVLAGNRILNQTYCAPTNFSGNAARLLTTNGTKTNILLVPNNQFYAGVNNVSGQQFLTFIALYEPNAANSTVTDAPTEFYQSNYYNAFYLGHLPGFKMVYPSNFTGMNYVNGTWPVVIYALDNYTGPLPKVQAKDPWVTNNYTMPG